jgi:exo-poly-alpha-galacturonosidase
LVVPPAAFEDTHIVLVWEKPTGYSAIAGYNVYKNGALVANLPKTQLWYDFTGLTASSPYTLKVRSRDAAGTESGDSTLVNQSTTATPAVVFVHSFAAQNTDTTANTAKIQAAINACASNGKVVISAGETFISGALFLKSSCTFQIDGTLKGSDSVTQYSWTNNRFPLYGTGGNYGTVHYPTNYMGLINACSGTTCSLSTVRLTGSGTVSGGTYVSGNLTTLGNNEAAAHGDSARGDLVNLNGVTNLYLKGLHFSNPAMHVIFISRSTGVTVQGINSNSWPSGSSAGLHNGDGIDLATSTNGYIFASTFDNGDDCINLNAGSNLPGVTENRPDSTIRVFDDTTLHGHGGTVFGSFTAAWIKNVTVEECTFTGTDVGLRFKTGTNRGGGADTVTAREITVSNIKTAVVQMTGSYPDSTGYPSGGVGYFKNVNISNVSGSVASGGYAVQIDGNPSPRHTNLTFTNVNITGSGGKGCSIYQVSNSTFTNVTAASGSFVYEPSSPGLTFSGCSPTPTAK